MIRQATLERFHGTPNEADDLQFAFGGSAGEVMRRHFLADAMGAKLSVEFKVYYQLRPLIPVTLRKLLQRKRNTRMQVDSDWYIPKRFIAEFKTAIERNHAELADTRFIHPWPNPYNFAVVLTHDIETSYGVRLVDQLAKLEESYGFRSSWNFVPHKYPIDAGLIADLRERGHEIGVHGYNHDGKLFLSERAFRRRSVKINAALKHYDSVGFRAPMVHRNLDWIEGLEVEYDASCFDVDPFQAMPGGIGSVWPFVKGRLVELPYTLPQDHTLLDTLGERSISIWQKKVEFLRSWSGMAMLITHPDYLDTPSRLGLYEQFLDYLRDVTGAWLALPRQVSRWWNQREESTLDPVNGQITGPAKHVGRGMNLPDLLPR